jgi:phosphoribosylaminoimidazole-succinocarboxamide synthase
MTTQKTLSELLDKTLEKTELPGLPEPVRGKVRDMYDLGDRLLLVTSDRISAFDVVLGTVPCKGQVLNTIATHWFEQTADLVPNHMLEAPDPSAVVVKKLKGLPVEVVMRRYLTGSLWRDYEGGTRQIYGITLPDGMQRDQQFEKPILTPTTKAEQGEHDMPLSPAEIVEQNLVDAGLWKKVEEAARALFERGEQEAHKQGLILVDTKYEFGLDGQKLLVMDEIHTPDSSRYWEREEYQARYDKGDSQKMLDKENIRQWLLERGFSGQGSAPPLTDEVRVALAGTYLNLQKRLTGSEPVLPSGDPNQRLAANLRKAGIIK